MGSGIEIERTHDAALIRRLALHPAVFPHISDDYTRDPDKFQPLMEEFVIYLVAHNEGGHFGFGIFIPRTHSCYEAHLAFLPEGYGEPAINAFKQMFQWIWDNTDAARITGEVPVENRVAISFIKRAGATQYGLNPASHLSKGILRDRVCLGISRP